MPAMGFPRRCAGTVSVTRNPAWIQWSSSVSGVSFTSLIACTDVSVAEPVPPTHRRARPVAPPSQPPPKETQAAAKGKEVVRPTTRPRACKVTQITSPPAPVVVEVPPVTGPSGAAKVPLFAEGAESGVEWVAPLGAWLMSNDAIRLLTDQ